MLSQVNKVKALFKSRNSYNDTYVSELISSIHRADIKAAILSILWAAGPVTIIAITLGYYLSHGQKVPLVTVAYFSFYVFFVGLVGFISKIVFDSIKHRNKEQMQDKFLSVIEESYQSLYLSKKIVLSNLTDRVRDNKIAYEILAKSHPTSKEIFYAFELHFDKKMAEFAEIIYLHRDNGFPIDTPANKRKLIKFYKQISTSQSIPEDLKEKFLQALVGKYSDLKRGLDRKAGFLSKVYNSAGMYNLFDLEDANNVITLFIELLSGRKIYYLKAVSKFEDAKKDYLFNSIEKLRTGVLEKYNHILGIYKQCYLAVSEVAPDLDLIEVVDTAPDITNNLNQLEQSIKQLSTKNQPKEIKKLIQQNKNRFYQRVSIVKTRLKRMNILLNQWKSLEFGNDEKLSKNIEHQLAYIFLEEQMRMSIAYKMFEYINHEHDFSSKTEQIKAYARQIVKILQESLDLQESTVLTAIESSPRANLSSIRFSNSTTEKLNTTYNLCKSVKTNIVELRKQLNKILVAQYI
ncbi:hypothetical protein [Francisella philomiragia]|uniref:Uncharacterized protein n=1 Tax=Francisella philomiragia TaxID=28110 RepID=A0ABS1GBW8_9GAMM|nr:hypothetical protein [Francisella philomiragia]MBK2258531.1 hypothetical protein [Francisella philomiragia]MBK2302299.1 hypothetical protein [Francisella philomiragia]